MNRRYKEESRFREDTSKLAVYQLKIQVNTYITNIPEDQSKAITSIERSYI